MIDIKKYVYWIINPIIIAISFFVILPIHIILIISYLIVCKIFNFKKKWAYISGPISAELSTYKDNFKRYSEVYEVSGYFVLNPATNWFPNYLKETPIWIYCMIISLVQLSFVEVIILLPRWEDSSGATIEALVAHKLKYKKIEVPFD